MTIDIKRNKSFTYILPLFDVFVEVKYFELLQNTYLWFDDNKEDVFCLLYKFDGSLDGPAFSRKGFTMYEQRLRENEYYIDDVDYGQYVLFIFNLPEDIIEEKHKFIEGKYSKLTDESKSTILKFFRYKYGNLVAKTIENVLVKAEALRIELSEKIVHHIPEDAELSSIIDPEDELFKNQLKPVIKEDELQDLSRESK